MGDELIRRFLGFKIGITTVRATVRILLSKGNVIECP